MAAAWKDGRRKRLGDGTGSAAAVAVVNVGCAALMAISRADSDIESAADTVGHSGQHGTAGIRSRG